MTKAPRLLSDADQAISDAAVAAVTDADQDRRLEAWRVVGDLAPPAAERPFHWSAYLLLSSDPMWEENAADIVVCAGELLDIHERHLAAVAARKRAG
jgi:hypothetical protein